MFAGRLARGRSAGLTVSRQKRKIQQMKKANKIWNCILKCCNFDIYICVCVWAYACVGAVVDLFLLQCQYKWTSYLLCQQRTQATKMKEYKNNKNAKKAKSKLATATTVSITFLVLATSFKTNICKFTKFCWRAPTKAISGCFSFLLFCMSVIRRLALALAKHWHCGLRVLNFGN